MENSIHETQKRKSNEKLMKSFYKFKAWTRAVAFDF